MNDGTGYIDTEPGREPTLFEKILWVVVLGGMLMLMSLLATMCLEMGF